MKELLIVRHGPAVNTGEQGVRRDADRMLSEEGREKTRAAALGLKTLGVTPQSIATSPLVRARETAEIFAQVLGGTAPVVEQTLLAPGGSCRRLVKWINTQAHTPLMLVGHMPDVEELTGFLLTAEPSVAIRFRKAAVCSVAWDRGPLQAGAGQLQWLLPPKVLRTMARAES